MNFDNIKDGDIVKNYTELCKLLEIKKTGGDSKKADIKEFANTVDYHMEGFKFVIDKVKKDAPPYFRDRGSTKEYIYYMEFLLITKLKNNKGKMTASKTGFAKEMLMIHDDFSKYYDYSSRRDFSDNIGVEPDIVDEFIDVIYKAYDGAVDTVLKNLEKNKVIKIKEIFMVYRPSFVTKSGLYKKSENRIATQQEIEKGLEIENETMKKYGRDMSEVISSGNSRKYHYEVKDRLIKEIGFVKMYKAYELISTENIINNEYIEKLSKLKDINNINHSIIEKWNSARIATFEEKHIKALKKEQEFIDKGEMPNLTVKERLRKEEYYLPTIKKIQKILCVEKV